MLDVKKLIAKLLGAIQSTNSSISSINTNITNIKAKTDKLSLGTNFLIAINASNNPYMRWTNGSKLYQVIFHGSGIRYQTSTNGGSTWTDVWNNH